MALTAVHNYALGYIGWARQAARGTAVAPTKFARWQSISKLEEMLKIGKYSDGNNRDYSIAVKEEQWYEGGFTSMVFPDTTAHLLLGFHCTDAGGQDAISGAGDPWTHTFPPATESVGPLNYYTFEGTFGYQNEVTRVTDCMVGDYKLVGKAGAPATAQWGFVGRIAVPTTTPTTVAFETDRPASFADATLTFGSGLTAVSADVVDFTITAKQALEHVLGHNQTVNPVALVPNRREFTLEATIFAPDNKVNRDIFHGGDAATTTPVVPTYLATFTVKWDLGGSPDHYVQLVLNNIALEMGTPTYSADAKAFVQKVKGTVIRSGTTTPVTVTVNNAITTAYDVSAQTG